MNKGIALLLATSLATPALAQPKNNGSPVAQAETVHLYLKANGTDTMADPSKDPVARANHCAGGRAGASRSPIWLDVLPQRAEQPSTNGVAGGVLPAKPGVTAAGSGYVGLNPPDRSAGTGADTCDEDADDDGLAAKAAMVKCQAAGSDRPAGARRPGALPPDVGVAKTATELKVKPLADRKSVKPPVGASGVLLGNATAATQHSTAPSATFEWDYTYDGKTATASDCDGKAGARSSELPRSSTRPATDR